MKKEQQSKEAKDAQDTAFWSSHINWALLQIAVFTDIQHLGFNNCIIV